MALKIPDVNDNRVTLVGWTNELIKDMEQSRQPRIQQYSAWRMLYLTGSQDGNPVPRNMLNAHIDTVASYLYSPRNIRFAIEYDRTVSEDVQARSQLASSHLTRIFKRRNGDFVFKDAVEWALVKGSTFVKTIWGHSGHDPYVVHPEMMGVYREDICGIERQEAFFHSMYVTPSIFERMLFDHPRRNDILKNVQATVSQDEDPMRSSLFRQIIIGQNQPVATGTPPSSNAIGNVAWIGGALPFLAPELQKQLIRIDEVWVQDAEREDWTTIQIANQSEIIEGDIRRRNLCDVKGEQPFSQVCPNNMDGYFWGTSEITQLETLQEGITTRIVEIDRIEKLQAHPPIAGIGGQGMDQERYDQLMSPDGWLSESEPGAKIENMAPKMPEGAYADLDRRFAWFHDQSGLNPTLRGENQPGVRAGGHAETLVRTGSPRILDRALLLERQLEVLGDFWLKVEQNKNPDAFKFTAEQEEREFLLEQLPEDYIVTVDANSASPAFSEEATQKALALRKAGAIDDKDFIRLLHPPREDSLIAAAEKRAAAEAQFRKENPELWAKQKGKRR